MITTGKKILFFRFLPIFFPLILGAQLYDNALFLERGQQYFGMGNYPASWQAALFETDFDNTADQNRALQFKILSNALRLNLSGAEKMLAQFKTKHPGAYESKTIDLDVANFYFNNQEYRYALKWFLNIEESFVPKFEQPEFYFNKGYSLFSAGRYSQAKPFLEKVKTNKNYESDVHYYLGHIAYQLNDFDKAATEFASTSDPDQKENLKYFQTDMNFRLGRFEQAISSGIEILDKVSEEDYSELSKIIGESYFNLKQYDNALLFLRAYKGKKGKWSNEDFYQLGFAYYKSGEFENAMEQFNKIIGAKNALAQNAYYYLADCYLKTSNKTAALNAFKSAKGMDFDSSLQEDAFLQYAKLSYEIGNPYEEAPQVLVNFIELYPKNKNVKLIEELLIDSYTRTANYDAAIEILEGKWSFKNDATLQKVYTLKGIEAYTNGAYKQAEDAFQQSLKFKERKNLQAYALYWIGRSYFDRNLFDQALEYFKRFKNHDEFSSVEASERLDYDMAYAYFKLREYSSALAAFEAFNSKNSHFDTSYQRDTYLRLGDCNFALKQYWPAMEHYNIAIAFDNSNGAYALFQKGISYGFVDRIEKKIETLLQLLNRHQNDAIIDDALFELASAYSSNGDYQNAIKMYDKLRVEFNRSPYLAQSSLNKALILYNQENFSDARIILEEVVLKYKGYAIAEQALRTLKEIAVDLGQVSEFSRWLKAQNLETYSDIDLEKTAFQAAEKQFLLGKFNAAEKLLEEYLDNYPLGAFVIPATYYMAEVSYTEENFDKAIEFYKLLVGKEVSIYTEKALVRIITLFKNKTELIAAISYLENLEQIATSVENKKFALLNLMHAYFQNSAFEKTLEGVDRVLTLPELEQTLKWDAYYLKAQAALNLKDSLTAFSAFEVLEKSPKTEWAAEAFYVRAERYYQQKDYSNSNDYIQKIAANSGSSSIWSAKALLLLAKNYSALNDSFQAIFVLESVIENFQQYPEVIIEAQPLLSEYKQVAAEQNSSINQNQGNE